LLSIPVETHLVLGFQARKHFIVWIEHQLYFLRLVNLILLENLAEVLPVGSMALFYVAHQLILLFIFTGTVLNMTLERIINLMI
jgi:hypothetical protein